MAEGRPGSCYTIDSLYLDTWDLQLYAANNLELPRRFKARIRSYPAAPGSPAFFEIKGRDGDIILKTRGPVPRDQVAQLLDRPPRTLDNKAVERFLSLRIRHNLEPVAVVRYEREPWISTLDSYARVTFDTHIRHQRMDQWCPEPDERAWRYADSAPSARSKGFLSPVILELKFERAVPSWLSRIVAKFNLDRQAFSKYGTAIKALHSPPELRTVREPR